MRNGSTGPGLSLALEELLRRPDSPVRRIVMAQAVEKNANGSLRAHTRKTRDDWGQADFAAAGPPPTLAGFSLLPEGDVRLVDNITTLLSQANHPNAFTDLNKDPPFDVLKIEWAGTDQTDVELARLKLWLDPRIGAATREVVQWKVVLKHVAATHFRQNGAGVYTEIGLVLWDLCLPVTVDVTTDAEGEVVFDFTSLPLRPQPKRWGAPIVEPNQGLPVPAFSTSPCTLVFVYALRADGTPATGVGLGYDATLPSFNSAGNVVSGRHLVPAAGVDFAIGPNSLKDGGPAAGTPYVKIETGTYATATIAFTTNPFNLGGPPVGDVQLVLRGPVPTGCALTGQIRNDADSAWVTFTDGQWMLADLGLTPSTTRKLQAILATNTGTGSSLTPTLIELGLQAMAEVNLSKQTQTSGGDWAIDPMTLKGEIPELTLSVIRDGLRDYSSAIEELLSQNHIGDIRLALYWGAEVLARKDWLHVDDFLIDGSFPRGPEVTVKALTPLCLLRDFVPRYEPGNVTAPNADQSVGVWTTDAGGGASLYQRIDEANYDDTDFIRSELSPANSSYEAALATPPDPVGRRHIIDYRYRKDATGGEQIDLTVGLYQGATPIVVAPTHVNITTDSRLSCTAGSFSLTDEAVKQITDYTDLRVRFTANRPSGAGARRAVVAWCRFRTGGKRDQVAYPYTGVPIATLKAVYDDLLANALAIDARYRGPGVEDAVNTVAKVLFEGAQLGKPIGKAEIDAIAFIAGSGIISSQGKIVAREMYGSRAIRAIFPSEEIRIESAGPGYQERQEEYFVKSNWNPAKGDFDDEARAFSSGALLNLGQARLNPPRYADDEVSKWLSNPNLDANGLTLAERIASRQVLALGTGLIEWRFTSNYPYPELEPGDLVAVETDQFVARDPNVARAIAGRTWATGVISRCDVSARKFSVWIQNYMDIVPTSESADRLGLGPATPHIMALKARAGQGGEVYATIVVNAATAVRLAVDTATYPTDAVTRAAALQTVDAGGVLETALLASLTPGQALYIKAFCYERIDGSGLESPAVTTKVTLGTRPRGFIFDDGKYTPATTDSTGKPQRDQVYNDGKYALKASDTVGKETDDDLFVDSTKRVKVGTAASPSSIAKTIRVPHGECVAAVNTATWAMVAGYLRTNTPNVATEFEASVVLPKGVTITGFRARMYKQNAGDSAVAVLRRGADDGTQTLLKTLTLSTAAAWTTVSDTLTETVGDNIYRCTVSLNGVASALDARFMWFELDYTTPDYATTY